MPPQPLNPNPAPAPLAGPALEPQMQPRKFSKVWWVVVPVVLIIFCGAGVVFASPATRTAVVASIKKILQLGVAASIEAPLQGETLYENSTTTIKFLIKRLPETAVADGYRAKLNLVGPDGSQELISNVLATYGITGGEYDWYIPDYLIGEFTSTTSADYTIELIINKLEPQEYTQEELDKAAKYGFDVNNLPVKYVTVEQTRATRPFKILKTTTSLLQSENSGYKSQGVITIGALNVFDVWGGRYLLRLDDITNTKADFTILSDTTVVTSFSVPIGSTAPITLPVIEFAEKWILTGIITFNKLISPKVGEFNLVLDSAEPRLDPTFVAATQDSLKVLSNTGKAPLYSVGFQYTINTDKDCSKHDYAIDYGLGKEYKISIPSTKCSQIYQNNSPVGYLKPGTYTATLKDLRAPNPKISAVTFTINEDLSPPVPTTPVSSGAATQASGSGLGIPTHVIHLKGSGSYSVYMQQESDPVMKRGDSAEIRVNGMVEALVKITSVGAAGSYDAEFEVITPGTTQTVSARQSAVLYKYANGTPMSFISMQVNTPVKDDTAAIHFNFRYNTGDE